MLHIATAFLALSMLPTSEAPALSSGELLVKARPWATCAVAGAKPRTTPVRKTLAPGEHTVVCRYKGKQQTKKVTVTQGQRTEVMFDMFTGGQPTPPIPTPAPSKGMGMLVVSGLPWAKCTVAGISKTTRFRLELKPGTYPMVCKRGQRKKTRTVSIKEGKTTRLTLDMRQ